jgi:glycosyltransferase involved in cell wall biosynthesis
MTTSNRPLITTYCLDWHITTSGAFMELLVKPLAPYADFRLVGWKYYEDLPLPREDELTIFCQYPPPESWLRQSNAPVIWIPMADHTLYPPSIDHHPSVRVVAFSHEVATWAEKWGLPYLRLQYFLNPDDFAPAKFDDGLVMLYWNRLSFYRPRFLRRMCRALGIKKLIFRSKADEMLHKRYRYYLPHKLGHTEVETHAQLGGRDDFLALLRQCNIFLTPRAREGVGLLMLEALASGCAVFGHDAPTMNEYIQSGVNGYLFPPAKPETLPNRLIIGLWRLIYGNIYYLKHRKYPTYFDVLTFHDWDALKKLNLAELGAHARQSQAQGYAKWIASIPQYAEFILKDYVEHDKSEK